MKVLAVDFGEKKVGLAVSDELGMVTAKLPVLFAKKNKYKLEGLYEIARDVNAEVVLFGIPKLSVEFENEQEKEIKEFASEFAEYFSKKNGKEGDIPQILFWDESFSSKTAESGKSRKYINEKSDSEAARLFLQEFLDSPDGLRTLDK